VRLDLACTGIRGRALWGPHMNMTVETPPTAAPEWSYEALFASERQSAARARSFVSSQLIEHQLLRLVDPVRAVASELAANAILYARTPFTLRLSRTGPSVLLSVHGGSRAIPTPRSGQVMAEDGQGLNLVASLSRDWGIITAANDTKCVWATFDVRAIGDRGWA
jgi:hypothetical protein